MTTRALTSDEVRILDAALLERRRFRERAFLAFAVGTGFRASEILSVDWSQILTPSGEISHSVTIERAHLKGGAGARRKVVRSRRVPLTERVRGAIADYMGSLGTIPSGPVFKSRVGTDRPITADQAHRQLKRLARELGLDAERIGCHSTRKTFAAAIYRASGRDLVVLQRSLGHASVITSSLYIQTTEKELDDLVLCLDQTPSPSGTGQLEGGNYRRPGSL